MDTEKSDVFFLLIQYRVTAVHPLRQKILSTICKLRLEMPSISMSWVNVRLNQLELYYI